MRFKRGLIFLCSLLIVQVVCYRFPPIVSSNLAAVTIARLWRQEKQQLSPPICQAQVSVANVEHYLDRALNRASPSSSILINLGRVWWLEGQCGKAVDAWTRALASGALHAAVELLWAGEISNLPLDMRAALARVAYTYGAMAERESHIEAACQWYEREFSIFPERKSAQRLAHCYLAAGEQVKVESLWQTLLDTHSSVEDSEYWWAKAKLGELTEDWIAAALAYTQGAYLSSESYDFWMNAGRAWRRSSQWPEAIAAYEQAHQAKPAVALPCLSLGNIYLYDEKQYDKALEWYLLAQSLEPDNFATHYWVGVTYYSLGNDNEAESSLTTALAINPEYAMSAYYLAQIYYNKKDYSAAESWLTYALSRTAEPPASWWSQLGEVRLELHNCMAAREAYQRALEAGMATQSLENQLSNLKRLCDTP